MTAGDSDYFRAHAIAKAWDLSGARKPGPDDTDSYRRLLHGPLLYRILRRFSQCIFRLSFSICHLSLTGNFAFSSIKNGKWKMTNGK
jgi:hypothetical protein